MKQFVTFIFMILCPFISVNAQNIIEHLQKNTPGKGVVTVNQSKEIDELVNGKEKVSQPRQNYGNGKKSGESISVNKRKNNLPLNEHSLSREGNKEHEVNQNTEITDKAQEKKETHHESHKQDTTVNTNEDFDIPVIDMRKKVMRHSYRVTGYRVQAFAGGNSRKDRIAAQKAGNAIKMKYPDQPVYVHFYSPRWICRVGNFRDLDEATKMLHQIRAMGYRSACLVKGMITVQK